MEPFKTATPNNLTDEEKAIAEALLHYLALEKVFDQNNSQNLPAIKQKMLSTITDLERVVRRGEQAEAKKAARIIQAYQTTLNFLDELERRRRNQKK